MGRLSLAHISPIRRRVRYARANFQLITIALAWPSVYKLPAACTLINTDAQSAGPPKLDQPQHNHSTANSRSRRSRNHARGSLGSLGLASLFACCFVPFSLRWFGIRVATLPASLGWASRRPKLCITQLGLAARSSALLVAAARIVRRRVVGLHCAHMLTTPIGPRIVRCSVSLGRAARSPATRRYS